MWHGKPQYSGDGLRVNVLHTLQNGALEHQLNTLTIRHLRCVLNDYFEYYNLCRVHQSLEMDVPDGGKTQALEDGKVIAIPHVGRLHHHYEREAA